MSSYPIRPSHPFISLPPRGLFEGEQQGHPTSGSKEDQGASSSRSEDGQDGGIPRFGEIVRTTAAVVPNTVELALLAAAEASRRGVRNLCAATQVSKRSCQGIEHFTREFHGRWSELDVRSRAQLMELRHANAGVDLYCSTGEAVQHVQRRSTQWVVNKLEHMVNAVRRSIEEVLTHRFRWTQRQAHEFVSDSVTTGLILWPSILTMSRVNGLASTGFFARPDGKQLFNVLATGHFDYRRELRRYRNAFERMEVVNEVLKDDLVLVRYGKPGDRLMWWTPSSEANRLGTLAEVHDALALLSEFGERTHVMVARIPRGARLHALVGRAAPMRSSVTGEIRLGGGLQYQVANVHPNWVVEVRKLPSDRLPKGRVTNSLFLSHAHRRNRQRVIQELVTEILSKTQTSIDAHHLAITGTHDSGEQVDVLVGALEWATVHDDVDPTAETVTSKGLRFMRSRELLAAHADSSRERIADIAIDLGDCLVQHATRHPGMIPPRVTQTLQLLTSSAKFLQGQLSAVPAVIGAAGAMLQQRDMVHAANLASAVMGTLASRAALMQATTPWAAVVPGFGVALGIAGITQALLSGWGDDDDVIEEFLLDVQTAGEDLRERVRLGLAQGVEQVIACAGTVMESQQRLSDVLGQAQHQVTDLRDELIKQGKQLTERVADGFGQVIVAQVELQTDAEAFRRRLAVISAGVHQLMDDVVSQVEDLRKRSWEGALRNLELFQTRTPDKTMTARDFATSLDALRRALNSELDWPEVLRVGAAAVKLRVEAQRADLPARQLHPLVQRCHERLQRVLDLRLSQPQLDSSSQIAQELLDLLGLPEFPVEVTHE